MLAKKGLYRCEENMSPLSYHEYTITPHHQHHHHHCPPHCYHSHPHHYSHPQKGTEAQECFILTRFTVAMSAINIPVSQALGHPCKPSAFPSSPPHPTPYVLPPHSSGGGSKILASCLAERPYLFISPQQILAGSARGKVAGRAAQVTTVRSDPFPKGQLREGTGDQRAAGHCF